ncbi:MAG: DUF177 domain-containing protein [Deltaproteobacteria bacterium]|nr:DUF177 domain-containing protein [Deltaproteobacteria bacterium]
MRVAIEDIKPELTELHFTEGPQGLNQLLMRDGEADYRLNAPLQIDLRHLRSGDDLLFSGAIQGELVGQCGRCLEEYPLTLSREFSVVLTPHPPIGRETELSYDELSASFYSGEIIDVSALVHEEALLALPIPPLCREDCKGLCSQCGANRNTEECTCQPLPRNSRLATLSALRGASSSAARQRRH